MDFDLCIHDSGKDTQIHTDSGLCLLSFLQPNPRAAKIQMLVLVEKFPA